MPVAQRPAAEALREHWNQLYTEYYQLALATARQRVRDHADAEDAAQRTFMDAYQILVRGDEVQNWPGLIVTIAKRAAGKVRSRAERSQELEVGHATSPRSEQDSAERKREFQDAFTSLSDGEQKAVYLSLVEGLSSAEVGIELGTTTASAEHLLSRGRAHLAIEIVDRNNVVSSVGACDRSVQTITRYLANRMSPDERTEFKQHAMTCSRCQLTVERVRDFRGFVLLLLPAGLAALRRDELYARIQAQPVAAHRGLGGNMTRGVATGTVLLLFVAIGGAVVTHRPAPAAPLPPAKVVAADLCPTGPLGGLAYIDGGNVMYRSSPTAPPQQLSSSGHADALAWTPDGTTLIYKEAASASSLAGQLIALHPGSAPFWTFGKDIESFAISPDGKSIAALAQHQDSGGNWDGWTLYIGPVGGNLTVYVEGGLVIPGGLGWRDSPGGEPFLESIFVPRPGFYEGVFWFGSSIYIAQTGSYAAFDTAGNETSNGWFQLSPDLKAQIASIGQPPGSAIHFTQRAVALNADCAGSTKPIVAGANFTSSSSSTLMVDDDPANPRAALAVEASNGASGGDIYLVTADGQAVALTTDHSAYLPLWQPSGK